MGLEIATQNAENSREKDRRRQYTQGEECILLVIRQKEFSAEKCHQCSDSADNYRINQGTVEDAVCVAVLFKARRSDTIFDTAIGIL